MKLVIFVTLPLPNLTIGFRFCLTCYKYVLGDSDSRMNACHNLICLLLILQGGPKSKPLPNLTIGRIKSY